MSNPVPGFAEWQFINVALDKVQRSVEIGAGVVALLADVKVQTAVIAALIIHGLLPGKCGRNSQSGRETAVQFHLEGVIAG